jgi:hypothetical protein
MNMRDRGGSYRIFYTTNKTGWRWRSMMFKNISQSDSERNRKRER